MKSVAFLLASSKAVNIENDVDRTFSQDSQIASKMLKMFSISKIDYDIIEPSLRKLVKNPIIEPENNLKECFDQIPSKLNGKVITSSCQIDEEFLSCDFECNSSSDSLLDSIQKMEIKCGCTENVGGITFKVPCKWSELPPCAHRLPTYTSNQCGPIYEDNGSWNCENGDKCSLSCNNGYEASDKLNPMQATCNCNKHAKCKWQKPSQCQRVNKFKHICNDPYHAIGNYNCTGKEHGEMCNLQCPHTFKTQQFGTRECICDNGGGCDWVGDVGKCIQSIDIAALADFETSSLLSTNRCKKLPTTSIGIWRCSENADNCQLTCPAGMNADKSVGIECFCKNDICMYNHNSASGVRFAITSDFSAAVNFTCSLYEEDSYDGEDYFEDPYQKPTQNNCFNLPQLENGIWNCHNGTCSLICSDVTGNKWDELTIDCLTPSDERVNYDQISCSNTKSRHFKKNPKSLISGSMRERLNVNM